jgi:hypothetical protein
MVSKVIMIRRLRLAALLGLAIMPASATTLLFANDSPSNTVGYNQTVNGVNLSGVVELITSANHGCSGALLSDMWSILTAAHCITTSYGSSVPSSVSVNFLGQSGFVSVTSTQYIVNSGWMGDGADGGDLAILRLSQAAPAFATGYSLYSGFTTDPILMVGYGVGGTGTGGENAGAYPFGTLREGLNRYDVTGNGLGWSANVYAGDFDGVVDGQKYGPLGSDDSDILSQEVGVTHGDSGGPSFYSGQIIGIHSFLSCYIDSNGRCLTTPGYSYSSSLGPYYGELFADTGVGGYVSWIQANTLSPAPGAPEAGSGCLAVLGLAALAAARRRITSRRSRTRGPE